MVNQQLIDYIAHQLQMGVAKGVIKSALLESGWPEPDIDDAMSHGASGGVAASITSAAKPAGNGSMMTSDIFQPKNEPVFDPRTAAQPARDSAVGAAAKSFFSKLNPGERKLAAAPVETKTGPAGSSFAQEEAKSGMKKYGVMGVAALLLVACGGLGWYAYSLGEEKAAAEEQLVALEAEKASATGQVAALAKDKNDLSNQITLLTEANKSLLADIAIFKVPDGSVANATGTVSVKGVLHGGDKLQYSVTTKNDVIVFIKNWKEPNVDAVLKAFVGTSIEVSGEHVLGSREVAVLAVNGTAVPK
jgi:hypothetical protein